MGTIKNGGNGAFSGKAGSFIGSSWNGINYMKGIPKASTKPATLKQLDQRKRFGAVLTFLGPIKDVLNLGYKGQTGNKVTGFNMGIQYALANAVTGIYPDYEVDPTKILISKGTLQEPIDVLVTATVAAKLKVSWFLMLSKLNAFGDDSLFIVIYNLTRKLFLVYEAVAMRDEATIDIDVPTNFAGEIVFVHAFFQQRDGGRCSKSVYAGSVIML